MYIATSGFFHASVACHLPSACFSVYACVPWRVPETIRCVPVQIGVTMFSCQSSGKGTDQSDSPLFASIPSIDPSVIVTIWRLLPTETATGDA